MALGDLLITQDSGAGRPAKIIDITTHSVSEVPSITIDSENGVIAADGSIILSDKSAFGTNAINFYDVDFALVATVTTETISQGSGGQGNVPVAYDGTYFYSAQDQSGTIHVARFSLVGAVIDTWDITLPAGWLRVLAIAVSRDSSTLFYTGLLIAGTSGTPIKRWDLVNDVGLTDFYTPGAGIFIVDTFVMADDVIMFGITDYAGTASAVRYSMGGVLQDTYTFSDPFGAESNGDWFLDHLAPAHDDPDSFWAWYQQTDDNPSARDYRWIRYLTSTGMVLDTIDDVVDQFLDDTNGIPNSCPLIAAGARAGGGSPTSEQGVIGPLVWVHWPRVLP